MKRRGLKKEKAEKRGYRVVFADGVDPDVGRPGEPAYLESHPDGVSREEAERLSAGLAAETEVVQLEHVELGE